MHLGFEWTRRRRGMTVALGAALAVAGMTRPARAQDGGRGFLFQEPLFTLSFRGGYDRANANSGIFSFTTDQLTLDRGDFSSPSFAADLGIRLTPRLDLVIGSGVSSASRRSEFRHLIGSDNLPIEQSTTFTRVPLTASLKMYLTPRGRAIGHYAWIPAKLSPYVGLGGGAMWYRFDQTGDFVDANSQDIFNDHFDSSGWAAMGHAMAGVDFALGTRWALTAEGRYTIANAPMSRDFGGFDRIDLSGFAVTAGVSVRF